MTSITDKIQEEASRLPEELAKQVYDFICFLATRHGIEPPATNPQQAPEWTEFFERHTRAVDDGTPISRDDLYAARLR